MEYPDGCSTAMRHVARRVATVKGRLVWFRGGFTTGTLFQTGELVYDKNESSRSQQLDDMTIQSSLSPHTAIVVPDASIKNDIATLVLHIYICDQPLVKMVHHMAFVTSTEAELFAIRCGISQACSKENISKIIIITDSIHAAKKIFDTKSHPYQIHTSAILNELRQFFTTCQGNHIEFWECPS